MFKPWGQWGGHTVIGVDSMPGTHTSSIGLAIRCAMDALIGMLIMAVVPTNLLLWPGHLITCRGYFLKCLQACARLSEKFFMSGINHSVDQTLWRYTPCCSCVHLPGGGSGDLHPAACASALTCIQGSVSFCKNGLGRAESICWGLV